MVSLDEYLSGDAPMQAAVYVVYDLHDRKVHVQPTRVSARHSLLREIETQFDSVDMPAVISDILEKSNGFYEKCDEAGFYNGISGDEIFEPIMTETLKRRILNAQLAAQISLNLPSSCTGAPRLSYGTAVPYDRHIAMPPQAVIDSVGDAFIDDEKEYNIGHYEVFGSPLGDFSISMAQQVPRRLPYVTFKIDSMLPVSEKELDDGYFAPEMYLSSPMSDATLEAVCDHAKAIVEATIKDAGAYEMDQGYKSLIANAEGFEVVRKQLITVN